jgi:uncharacterized membrane protein YdjX (TVP38/TMEM64 family)
VHADVKTKLITGIVAVVLIAAVVAAVMTDLLDPQNLRDIILSFGYLGPVVFVLLYVIAVFFPYGTSVLTVAAGLAYGTIPAAALTLATTLVASLVPMTLSRRLGRDWVEDKLGKSRVGKYADMINDNAFLVFFYLRLIPSIPYELQNYVAGVSRITYKQFVLASFLGVTPIIVIMTFFGDALTSPGSTRFWIAAGIYAVVLFVPLGYILITRKGMPQSDT